MERLLTSSLAQWVDPPGQTATTKAIVGLVVGLIVLALMLRAPAQARRPIVVGFTFIAGLFNVLLWLWPKPIDRQPNELPLNFVETVSFWLTDSNSIVTNFRSVISGFLIGLGVYSLLRIHLVKVVKQGKDWLYSLALLVSLVVMAIVGFADYFARNGPDGSKLEEQANWLPINYAQDFLFDGLLQNMDAAMFSVLAFYILSAAYRAFRARSVEASILLLTALILMLSLLGGVAFLSQEAVKGVTGGDPNHFMNNFTLESVATWLRTNVQGSSIRGLQLGVGVGLLALSLRIWLSLERSGRAS